MRVLLLNPPAQQGFIRSGRWTRASRAHQQWYPIHLAYCTGFLEQHGFNCGLLDACAKNYTSEMTYLYIVKVLQPNVIIYYWCYDNMDEDLAFADQLARHCRVILVGPWSLCAPDALLKTKRIHAMTYGEFEHTVLELLCTDSYAYVKGVIWRNHIDNILHTNAPRPLCSVQELDQMPFVTSIYKQFLDFTDYRQTSFKYPFIDMFTARGCPHSCTYCVWIRAFQGGSSYRARSMKNVMSELNNIRYGMPTIKQIFFQDDTLPQKHAQELSQAILDQNFKNEKREFCWGGYSRAELDYETLKLMKESGCRTLHVGYESPIQSNLDIIHKDLEVSQMEEFANNIKKLDMWTSATFMLFPWMTKKDIKFTIDWAKKIKPKRMNFIQAQGYPNTPYVRTLKDFAEHPSIMPFDEQHIELMSHEEMKCWEQWGFKQFYLYNPHFWWEAISHPREWKNVLKDAGGLVRFLRA